MTISLIAAALFVLVGVAFGIVGNIGVLVFPDIYTRLHASSKCSTSSVLSVLIACIILSGWSPVSGRIVVITVFFLVTGPITSHILGNRAWKRGIREFRTFKGEVDDD